MPYRILRATGVRANPTGSKSRAVSRGETVEPTADWQAEDLAALAEAGYAELVEPVEPPEANGPADVPDDPEAKAVAAAPENKAIESAPENAAAGPPEGAVSATHRGGGRYVALDAEGNEMDGPLYSREQVEAWGLTGD